MLILIGGFLSLVTRFTSYFLSSYQNFTIDKSLIKKVFSWKEPKLKENTSFFRKSAELYNFDMKQNQIKDTIQQRHVFRYFYMQAFCAKIKD